MELYKAIQIILNTHGKELISQAKLINFLADYQAFDARATRRVMQTFIQLGYGEQVLELDRQDAADKELKLGNMSAMLVNEGFRKLHVDYVLDSVSYGLGWREHTPDGLDEFELSGNFDKQVVQVGSCSFTMLYVSGGTFQIGATPEQGLFAAFDEKPSKEVRVSGFFIGETLVTQALWKVVMGDNPSNFKGENLPVERVTWNECQEFVVQLNELTGINFRLPTETEWEYAARGGCKSLQKKYSGADDDAKNEYMWWKENSQQHSHEVKTKLPNELGLYDMSGNVSEWCNDWYFSSYCGETLNPKGAKKGEVKVCRGGSWSDSAMGCRVSKRFSMSPKCKSKLVGLRLVASRM